MKGSPVRVRASAPPDESDLLPACAVREFRLLPLVGRYQNGGDTLSASTGLASAVRGRGRGPAQSTRFGQELVAAAALPASFAVDLGGDPFVRVEQAT